MLNFYAFIITCNGFSYLSNFNFIKTRELKTKNLKGCDVTLREIMISLKLNFYRCNQGENFKFRYN